MDFHYVNCELTTRQSRQNPAQGDFAQKPDSLVPRTKKSSNGSRKLRVVENRSDY